MRDIAFTKRYVVSLMRKICRENGIKLIFLTKAQGYGGYNYGTSAGNDISIAPFVRKVRGKRFKGVTPTCENPLECQLATFFHEFAHCRLRDRVPGAHSKFASNDTSTYQYEAWLTMQGFAYAKEKYGIMFSDVTVKWLLDTNYTYAGDAFGLNARKVTYKGYVLRQGWSPLHDTDEGRKELEEMKKEKAK